ncbi:MAG: insulinase family protein [Candidatus Rokubacteria bacterium]|nr:insulinase family protein [Candidatus Rokubacteria bacterium]
MAARLAPWLLVVLLGSACTVARPTLPREPRAITPTRHVLANGVRVIVQEHRASDEVALQLWVAAGGRDETSSELGLAHYLEHMLFKGTPARPPGFVDRDVESVGGRINAGTSLDYTYYHVVLPARRASAGVEMLADIAVNASLDAALLDREKRVVLEEMRLSEDNPRRFLMRQLYAAIFDGHPYGRPVIGTPDRIRSLARDTLVAFYRRHYVPESFTLVVVGAVSPAEVIETAARTLGRLPRSGWSRLPPPAAPGAHRKTVEIARAGAHAYLGMAWVAPRIDHADTPAVDLLVAILGQARSSRLTQALRERQPLVNSIGSAYAALEGAGVITVTAQLEAADVERAEQAILREVLRVRQEGVSEAERRRAVTAAEARHEFSMETADGRASALGRAETLWGVEGELAWVDRVRSVTREQLRAVARRYLDPERYVRAALVPLSGAR